MEKPKLKFPRTAEKTARNSLELLIWKEEIFHRVKQHLLLVVTGGFSRYLSFLPQSKNMLNCF